MHQANVNHTAELRGARRFSLVSWERPIGWTGSSQSSSARQPLGEEARRRILRSTRRANRSRLWPGGFAGRGRALPGW